MLALTENHRTPQDPAALIPDSCGLYSLELSAREHSSRHFLKVFIGFDRLSLNKDGEPSVLNLDDLRDRGYV